MLTATSRNAKAQETGALSDSTLELAARVAGDRGPPLSARVANRALIVDPQAESGAQQ